MEVEKHQATYLYPTQKKLRSPQKAGPKLDWLMYVIVDKGGNTIN